MTSSALTRPGERERLIVKFGQIDWTLTALLALIGALSGMMLYSIAGGSWSPWAGKHLAEFGLCMGLMVILAMVDLKVWFAVAYPVYGIALLLCVAVEFVGRSSLGATRWLQFGPVGIQPSEIMKIALVLGLARFYQGVSAADARWSWKLLTEGSNRCGFLSLAGIARSTRSLTSRCSSAGHGRSCRASCICTDTTRRSSTAISSATTSLSMAPAV